MATVRALAGTTSSADQWSLSKGFRDYLTCCFVSKSSGYSPNVNNEMQSESVANDNVAKDNDSIGKEAYLLDETGVISSRKDFEEHDEIDVKASLQHSSRDQSTADGNEAREGCFETSVVGSERKAADGASINSNSTDVSTVRDVSGPMVHTDAILEVDGMVVAVKDISGPLELIDAVLEVDGIVAPVKDTTGPLEHIDAVLEVDGMVVAVEEISGPLVHTDAALESDGVVAEEATNDSDPAGAFSREDPSRASSITVSHYYEALSALINEETYVFPVEKPTTASKRNDASIGDQSQSDVNSQLTKSTLVIRHDESGQPVTYHEAAVDVDTGVTTTTTATTSSPQHQRSLQKITENKSTADAPVDSRGGTLPSRDRLITQCGCLRLSFHYELPSKRRNTGRMSVLVCDAVDLPNEDRGGATHVQFHLVLLPAKRVRHKTRIRPGGNTTFDEIFEFRMTPDDLSTAGVRIRLYGCERLRRERMIGECVIWFSSLGIDLQDEAGPMPVEKWVILQPRSNLSQGESAGELATLGAAAGISGSTGTLSNASSDAGGSLNASTQHGTLPELMIGLSYSQLTGRLTVEVIKGSNFRIAGVSKPPDSQVKLAVMSPDGKPIGESKTSVRRGQPNPLFKETFMFQVALHQLPDISLLVSVYNVRSLKRKEMFGWFTIGKTNSSEEESSHWTAMRDSNGDPVCRWHLLLEP